MEASLLVVGLVHFVRSVASWLDLGLILRLVLHSEVDNTYSVLHLVLNNEVNDMESVDEEAVLVSNQENFAQGEKGLPWLW